MVYHPDRFKDKLHPYCIRCQLILLPDRGTADRFLLTGSHVKASRGRIELQLDGEGERIRLIDPWINATHSEAPTVKLLTPSPATSNFYPLTPSPKLGEGKLL